MAESIPEARLKAYCDAVVFQALRPGSLAFGVLSLLFGVIQWTAGDVAYWWPMAAMTTTTGVVLLSIRVLLQTGALAAAGAHAVMAVMAAFLMANVFVHMFVAQDMRQTTLLLILLIGVGCFSLSYGWTVVLLALGVGVWAVFAGQYQGAEPVGHYGYSVLTSVVVAGTVQVYRIQVHHNLARLRLQDEKRAAELEAAYQAAHESEERFRRLSEAAMDGVVVQRSDRIVDTNLAFHRLIGRELSELVGRSLLEFIAEEDREALRRYWDECRRDTLALTGIDGQGGRFALELCSRTMMDGGEEVRVTAMRDVTQHRELECVLRAARDAAEAGNRAKSEFLANISHELRTPMNGVLGMASLLEHSDLGGEQREYLETLRRSGEMLLTRLNEILDHAQLEAGRLAPDIQRFDPCRCAEGIVQDYYSEAVQKGVELMLQLDVRMPALIESDSARLRQVLGHLISNAVKFTNRGEIVLRGIVEQMAPGRTTLRFSVDDTGIGIPEAKRSEIFKPFSQADMSASRSYGGTGLGLAICKQLVELLGGRIWFESDEGIGSRFHIAMDVPTVEAATPETRPAWEGYGALLVTSSVALAGVWSAWFHRHGIRLLTATVGQVAEGRMKGFHDANILLIDIPPRPALSEDEGLVLRQLLEEDPRPTLCLTAGVEAAASVGQFSVRRPTVIRVDKPLRAFGMIRAMDQAMEILQDRSSVPFSVADSKKSGGGSASDPA